VTGLSVALLLAAAAFSSCSRTPAPEVFAKGSPIFSFDYTQVTELALSKDDPQTGQRFNAEFKKTGLMEPSGVRSRWEITSPPDGQALTDRLADGKFIEHLLDTLRNLRTSRVIGPTSEQAEQAGQALAPLGLKPPHYWLRWKAGEQTFEVKLGARVDALSVYCETAGTLLEVEGASLRMLEYLSGFKKIRHHKLISWELDDMDQWSVKLAEPSASKPSLSAERNSGDWKIKTALNPALGRKLTARLNSWLEMLAHLEIETFEAAGTVNAPAKPWMTIEWRDRKSQILKIEVDSSLRARISNRPGAIFALNPGARTALLSLWQ